jgi:hypothetical protein
MIAALALSTLVGTWSCSMNGDPNVHVRYTLRPDHSGTLISYVPGSPPWRAVRRFTFSLEGNDVIETFRERGASLIELHSVRVNGRHLTDDMHVYWHENTWTPIPSATILDCKR